MNTAIFDFKNYKEYLKNRLSVHGVTRGLRAKLAHTLKCQGAYISQILNTAHTHFSLEHAVLIDEFLEHTPEESHYFLLLVHHARAGSKKLEKYYETQISDIQSKRKIIASRIRVTQNISYEHQMIYYSAWYYSAVHGLLTIHSLRSKQALAEYLHLPLPLITETLDFLVTAGLATEQAGIYQPTSNRTHLGTDSPMLPKHHSNWRIRAINALDQHSKENLHYSGPITLSQMNAEKLKNLLLTTIEAMEPIIAEPNEEEGFGVCIDFFKLKL